jgi:hypothetical protein
MNLILVSLTTLLKLRGFDQPHVRTSSTSNAWLQSKGSITCMKRTCPSPKIGYPIPQIETGTRIEISINKLWLRSDIQPCVVFGVNILTMLRILVQRAAEERQIRRCNFELANAPAQSRMAILSPSIEPIRVLTASLRCKPVVELPHPHSLDSPRRPLGPAFADLPESRRTQVLSQCKLLATPMPDSLGLTLVDCESSTSTGVP